ncbi:MAG: glycosyltransferase family 2 protein [Methanomassiliicoccales archaeon]
MRASLVVLTYNQLKEGTIPCLESLFLYTPKDQFELIIVDNASSDGTPEHLRKVAEEHDNVVLILNQENKGYAGGNNDGMRAARGDCVVLLNNDTMATPGWLDSLLEPLEKDRSIGLICPVTNSAGNEQTVVIPSLNEENYVEVSRRYTSKSKGHLFETEKLGFYCVALRRDVLERVGLLDEKFGLGMFEDDDYCFRVKKAGYRLVINEGCFIYHKGSLSFKKLENKDYQQIFERNREYYQRKHGQPWLFNDLTLAYYRQMQKEIESLLRKDHPPVEAERIAARLKGFEYLVQHARELERNAGKGTANKERKLSRGLAMFKDEYLRGDRRSRLLFRRKVNRRFRPLENQEVIDALGKIRREEKFRRLLLFQDLGDFNSGGAESALASALASAGITVLYGTNNREKDAVEVTEKVDDRLHLMNQDLFGFLPHLVTGEEMVLFAERLGALDSLPDPRPSAMLVDLTGGRGDELRAFSEELAKSGTRALFLLDGETKEPLSPPAGQTFLRFDGKDVSAIVKWIGP